MSIVRTDVRTYVRTYDWMTKEGEEARSAGKATGPFESSELTEASLVRHGSRSCSCRVVRVRAHVCMRVRAVARLCAAGTRKLVRQPPPSPPIPIFLRRVCKSLSLRDESAFLSPLRAANVHVQRLCVCACTCRTYTLARSWIVFSLASECNRVGEGEPLARVPVLVLCRSRGRILSRVVLARTIFACGRDENYCARVCVCEGGGRVDTFFFFFFFFFE